VVCGLTLLAALLRLAHLGEPSLWWDEFITLGVASGPLAQGLAGLAHQAPSDVGVELFPPLQHAITHVFLLAGRLDWLVRLPVTLAGIATVPAVYLLLRRPLGRSSAFCGALLLALSVYHVHFSRELRPYALFMLENVLALHCLAELLERPRKGLYAAYGGLVCAMLYTSYMAATLLGAQLLYVGAVLALRFARGGRARREALACAVRLALALALAALAYLPWTPAQLRVLTLLRAPGQAPVITWGFVQDAFREFAAFAYAGEFPAGALLAGLGLMGALLALARRESRSFAWLLLLWAGLPWLSILLAGVRMELSSRYVFPTMLGCTLFAGHALGRGAAWLADRLLAGRAFPAATLALAGLACAWANAPNLQSLDAYYGRESSHYKDLAAWCAENRDNADLLLFANPRQIKLVTDWYLPDALPRAGRISGQGYLRALLLAPETLDAARLPGAAPRARLAHMDAYSLGLARTPERPLVPDASGVCRYTDDFSTQRFYEDVFLAENAAPSIEHKTLAAYEAGRPGRAVYRFRAPRGARLARADLTLEVSLYATPLADSDAVLTVNAAPEGGAPAQVARLGREALHDAAGARLRPGADGRMRAVFSWPLEAVRGAEAFDVALEFGPVTREMALEVTGLRLEARLDDPHGRAPEPEDLPLALLAQLPVAPWTPGERLVLSRAVHAFSLDGRVRAPGVGAPEELARYRETHPGQAPARQLAYPDGSPAVALYDPSLADPFVRLPGGGELALEAQPPTPRPIPALRLRGVLERPVIQAGESRLALDVSCPLAARLDMNLGGRARMVLEPLFAPGTAAHGLELSPGARLSGAEACLTCEGEAPCAATLRLDTGLPVRDLRVRAHPRVQASPGGANFVRALVSRDGVSWREIGRFSGSGSGRWEGLKAPRYWHAALDGRPGEVFLRFELSGSGAQLWSAPDARLRVDVDLDASALGPLELSGWPARCWSSSPRDLDVLFLERELLFPDRLNRTR